MTALATPPAAAAEPAVPTTRRFERVCADLMPEEVLIGRRLGKLKRRLAVAVLTVVVVVAGIYVWSWRQTGSAEDELGAAQTTTSTLQQSQRSYTPLVSAKAEAAAIQSSLRAAMTGDLRWDTLLDRIAAAAPRGVQTGGVNGVVTATAAASGTGAAPADSAGVLNRSGLPGVGTVTITGTADDKASVAAFVDKLAAIPGLAGVYPSSLTGQAGSYAFTVNAQLTSAALGGRFSSAPVGTVTTGVK